MRTGATLASVRMKDSDRHGCPLVVVASTTKSSEGVAAASFLDADGEFLVQVIASLHRDSEGVQIRRRHRAAAANSAHNIKRRGQRGRKRHVTARTEAVVQRHVSPPLQAATDGTLLAQMLAEEARTPVTADQRPTKLPTDRECSASLRVVDKSAS